MLKQAGGVVHYLCGDVIGAADQISDVWESLVVTTALMTFLMHWSFKTGYHDISARRSLPRVLPFQIARSAAFPCTRLCRGLDSCGG